MVSCTVTSFCHPLANPFCRGFESTTHFVGELTRDRNGMKWIEWVFFLNLFHSWFIFHYFSLCFIFFIFPLHLCVRRTTCWATRGIFASDFPTKFWPTQWRFFFSWPILGQSSGWCLSSHYLVGASNRKTSSKPSAGGTSDVSWQLWTRSYERNAPQVQPW